MGGTVIVLLVLGVGLTIALAQRRQLMVARWLIVLGVVGSP
jgi:hypothetical protein